MNDTTIIAITIFIVGIIAAIGMAIYDYNDCSTIGDRCAVSMSEQVWCTFIWSFQWIFIPLGLAYGTFRIHKIGKEKKVNKN
jgi:hypothetical protein